MARTEEKIVVCGYCKTPNRLLGDRQNPVCGRCREPLQNVTITRDGAPMTLTESNFRTEVLSSKLPVLVDVWAPWCGPCRMVAPQIDAVARQTGGTLKVGKLNSEEAPGIAQQLGVMSIPTLILFKDGREVARRMGAMNADQILAWVRQAGLL